MGKAWDVLVVGGGPAGMMAAYAAAKSGESTLLLERNAKLGRKLYITGKGRCNITNACDWDGFFAHICRGEKFLYSAYAAWGHEDIRGLLEEAGCSTKVERGGRVFPVSDRSGDVLDALRRLLAGAGVHWRLEARVSGLWIEEGRLLGVEMEDGSRLSGGRVILATGGLSYPATGSTGDGYALSQSAGHRICPTSPSLVPFEAAEPWCRELMGLSLKNVGMALVWQGKTLWEDMGELLFTHFGISGPLVLRASAVLAGEAGQGPWENCQVFINLKPALDAEQLDKRLLRDLEAAGKKQLRNSLGDLYPQKLIPVLIALSGIPEHKRAVDLTRAERQSLARLTAALPLTITGTRGYGEAVITRGGVDLREVRPGSMESKKLPGLYFAGEVLDLDALTGGYNLQIAWSTGYLAGKAGRRG